MHIYVCIYIYIYIYMCVCVCVRWGSAHVLATCLATALISHGDTLVYLVY